MGKIRRRTDGSGRRRRSASDLEVRRCIGGVRRNLEDQRGAGQAPRSTEEVAALGGLRRSAEGRGGVHRSWEEREESWEARMSGEERGGVGGAEGVGRRSLLGFLPFAT